MDNNSTPNTLTPEQYADMFRNKTSISNDNRKAMLARQLADLLRMNVSGNEKQQQVGLNVNLPIYDDGTNSVSGDLNQNNTVTNGKFNNPQNRVGLTYKRSF